MELAVGSVIFVVAILFMLGCTQPVPPTPSDAGEEEISAPAAPATAMENVTGEMPSSIPSPIVAEPTIQPEIQGPAGCEGVEKCTAYCLEHPLECKGWCDLEGNAEVCEKYGLKIEIPAGIPGSACTADADCYRGLICLDYQCDIPSPDNLARKSNFQLPGGCTSIQDCAGYCMEPANSNECQAFCENFPSFCTGLSTVRAGMAPPECQECTTCEEKDCILDCVYQCYSYMPLETETEEQIDTLKAGIAFQRNYQSPVKAVWEPGPAYNRIGLDYFLEDYRDLGVNTYSITSKYNHQNGELIHTIDRASGETADREKIASIIKAKKAGLQVVLVAHDLYDMFPDVSGQKGGIDPGDYTDDIEETALKWAQVAEDYQVEYFVPVNEFEYMLYENGYSAEDACRITNSLYRQIIPKVREIYQGKIYCRVGGMDAKFSCMDFSQCDVFGFTYGFSGGSPRTNFDALFATGEEVAERDGKSYLMAEAFSFNKAGWQACIDLHQAGIESYKENADHAVGYTFMGLIQSDPIHKNDCPISDPHLKNILVPAYREFFQWMGE